MMDGAALRIFTEFARWTAVFIASYLYDRLCIRRQFFKQWKMRWVPSGKKQRGFARFAGSSHNNTFFVLFFIQWLCTTTNFSKNLSWSCYDALYYTGSPKDRNSKVSTMEWKVLRNMLRHKITQTTLFCTSCHQPSSKGQQTDTGLSYTTGWLGGDFAQIPPFRLDCCHTLFRKPH